MDGQSLPVRSRRLRSRLGFSERLDVVLLTLLHLAPLAAIWTGTNARDWIVCGVVYFLHMFFVTAGYHRYFAHRAYKTNRFFQFLLAFFAQTSGQKGVIWWASHHRHHHGHSDTEHDIHSPARRGLWWSHAGWFLSPDTTATRWERVGDLRRFPELVFLNRHHNLPPLLVALTLLFVGGWSMFLIGFCLSMVLSYHVTFTINSLSHTWGTRRFETDDDSRNNAFLALLTLGEGWHNNHHYYPGSVRQGFRPGEIDLTYYLLKLMSFTGLVHDLKPVPARVLAQARQPETR